MSGSLSGFSIIWFYKWLHSHVAIWSEISGYIARIYWLSTWWYLYLSLNFCLNHLSQHPDNREKGYSNVLDFYGSIAREIRLYRQELDNPKIANGALFRSSSMDSHIGMEKKQLTKKEKSTTWPSGSIFPPIIAARPWKWWQGECTLQTILTGSRFG